MFFDEDINKHDLSQSKENFGFFTPNNTDYNMSLYEAIYERIYSRWKFHYILAFSLLFILSCNYPIFFSILFLDVIIQWSMLRYGVDNFIAQDSEYNMDQHDSQVEGGDIRLDPFVFLCYDSLGYVIYGLSSVGELICSEIYEYENYLGLQDKLIICSNNILEEDDLFNKNKYIYDNNDLLSFKFRNNIDLSKINTNQLFNVIYKINNIKYDFNYYFFSNNDHSYGYFDINKQYKI